MERFYGPNGGSASSSSYYADPGMSAGSVKSEPSVSGGSRGGIKYCGVCGDIAKSYHFGGLSCDSCKAFFRRSVQNDNYLHFQCCHQGNCLISVGSRKSCQYCRMQRCLGIGMEKSWVMTEEERKAMMKARAEKKLLKQLQEKKEAYSTSSSASVSSGGDEESPPTYGVYVPQVNRMADFMEPLEIKEIESIVTKYLHAYKHVPYRAELRLTNSDRPGAQIMEMFGTLIRRFAFYSRLMADFSSLPFNDQSILLKGSALEMCLLRGALVFDPHSNCWPNVNMSMYQDAPTLKLDNIGHMTSNKLFQMHMDFIYAIQQMGVDEPTVMLLVLIVLFTPERAGLQCSQWIERCQSHYTTLLEHYMHWRFGRTKARCMFGKLLTKMSDLRELSDSHNQRNLSLNHDEVASIQYQMQSLKLNPYNELKVVPEGNAAPVTMPPVPAHQACESSAATTVPQNHDHQAHHHQQQSAMMSSMAYQFMQAMQKSVNQVVSAPHFGYEWVTPDYEFDPVMILDPSGPDTLATASAGVVEEPPKALTPGVMKELYDALEEYVDQVNSG